MSVGERQTQQRQRRRQMPSFSSSLLEAIYHSIDEESPAGDHEKQRRNEAAQVEEEIESLRRAIMVEKWMENHAAMARSRHVPSNSGSSTDSGMFSSSETDSSASRSTPRPWISVKEITPPKSEGRFTRTKARAMKIYGDLRKVKEPISPGGKIASFLNSIFTPRNPKKESQPFEDWNSVRKSKSMKENSTAATTATCLLASRSCLSRNPSSKTSNKSKRVVRFCPVSVALDEGSSNKSKPRHDGYYSEASSSMPPIVGSRFIKKNIDSFRVYEAGKSMRRQEFRELYDDSVDIADVDDKSCASSDLFELESIGRTGFGVYDEELPVYETTSLEKMNKRATIC